jgi:hypothetical protein
MRVHSQQPVKGVSGELLGKADRNVIEAAKMSGFFQECHIVMPPPSFGDTVAACEERPVFGWRRTEALKFYGCGILDIWYRGECVGVMLHDTPA